MKKVVVLVASLFASYASFGQWTLDKSHAKLVFNVSHLMVSEIEGRFKSFDSKITSTKEDFSDAVIELTADVKSINTDDAGRDAHLMKPDFFDAEKYPTLSFKSTSFTKVEGKKYVLTGDLTMHGVTKKVQLDVVYNGNAIHPYTKKTIAGFKVSGKIKRTDFGVGSVPGAIVGEEVVIDSNLEFMK
jgi:polyisoprenoid-binding protein YceI